VLLSASCGAGPTGTTEPEPPAAAPSPAEPTEPAAPPEEQSPQPEPDERPVPRELRFTAPKLGGGTISGAEYAGRDVAVWFWAPW
jgi:hypothetical protein